MIAQIIHGSSFGGCVNYALDTKKDTKDAHIIAQSDNLLTYSPQSIIDSFELQASRSERCTKPLCHIILAASPDDTDKLSDDMFARITEDYLSRMGYINTQFVAIRHMDRRHPHVHILVNRVDNQGKVIKDSGERIRSTRICKDLTKEYGLTFAKGKKHVNENRLKGMTGIRFHGMHAVASALSDSQNWQQFFNGLKQAGVTPTFVYNPRRNDILGISFTFDHQIYGSDRMLHDVSFSGKQLDPSLSFSELCKILGNPKAMAYNQAEYHYYEAIENTRTTATIEQWVNRFELNPPFETLFPDGFNEISNPFPSFERTVDDPGSGTHEAIYDAYAVTADSLAILLMQPYQPYISGSGGGNTSSLDWGDDDKYKKKRKPSYSTKLHR